MRNAAWRMKVWLHSGFVAAVTGARQWGFYSIGALSTVSTAAASISPARLAAAVLHGQQPAAAFACRHASPVSKCRASFM
jgi:hypothetical protein